MTGFTAMCRTAWSGAQATAVIVFCIGTGMVVPLGLISFGIPTV